MSKKERDYSLFLEDIFTAIEKIERYTRGLSFKKFCKNDMAVDPVIRNFEVIGEAVKHLPEKIKGKYPYVEWKEAMGFRDVLIHEYFGIDLEAVWDTVANNIPSFKENVLKVFESEQKAQKVK